MGKYFTMSEMTRSTTAKILGLDNTPSADVVKKLEELIVNVLDPIREKWGEPINVNSGYRSIALNDAVGGVPTSQHIKGEAADISTGNKARNQELYNLIKSMGIEYDQLIDESNYTWVHISYREGNNRKMALKL